MRSILCVLALSLFGGVLATPALFGSPTAEPAKSKIDVNRLRGMKAAVADLEAGKLKLKSAALPVAAWHESYLDVLRKECGIEWEVVDDDTGKAGIELKGYNGVMIMEIEHRFGKGILEALQKKAEANFRKPL